MKGPFFMSLNRFCIVASALFTGFCLLIASGVPLAVAQSSSSQQGSSSQPPQEKSPTIVDPAGPTISLQSSPQLFFMAAALNACGYDEGLDDSAIVRKHVRDEINAALAKSEDARAKRDKICLYIAQHRLSGSERDISQYVSLALYLSPPPAMETTVELPEMPPDSTQVVEIVPLLKDFAQAVDLNGIWLSVRRTYDDETNNLHDPLSKMIVSTNLYLKMPASTYVGRRFVVLIEPMLSPKMANARIYGTDYVIVLSPVNGTIDMQNVRHVYLHYTIEPLLYSRTNAIDRMQPIMKEVREAPLEFRYRSETVPLVVECMIKAIEARTVNTGIPDYRIPAGVDRSVLPRYERERIATQQKQETVRVAAVQHDMKQGFVLTQYFFEQLIQFEKDAASLRDTIGEMVYGMDVEQQVHRARQTEFDQKADDDILQRSKPRTLTGLDLAEAKLAEGDIATANAMARKVLADKTDTLDSVAQEARADFILARVAIATGKPGEAIDDFQKTISTSKEPRLVAWSHIYLGRMLDLDCKRDQAVSEYQQALAARDGQQDTRLAAERGVKTAYAMKGHSCEEDADAPDVTPPKSDAPAPQGQPKPQ
jgi:predicted negative regulator of RcsB-dependent stress response